jgi:hypothetical protein
VDHFDECELIRMMNTVGQQISPRQCCGKEGECQLHVYMARTTPSAFSLGIFSASVSARILSGP